jgi:hypothetical protein
LKIETARISSFKSFTEIKTTLNQVDSEFLPKLRKQLESIPGDIREHKQNIDYLKLEVQKRGQRLK